MRTGRPLRQPTRGRVPRTDASRDAGALASAPSAGATWPTPGDLAFAGGVAVAAFLVRLSFMRAWNETGLLTSTFYAGDVRPFIAFASALLTGSPFDNGVPFHPPGWPMVLAAFAWVCGVDPGSGAAGDVSAIKVFVAVIGSLAAGTAVVLTRVVAGRAAMAIAGVLTTFHFGHAVISTVPNSEALYGLAIALTCIGALRAFERRAPQLPAMFAVGVAAGCTAVVRAEFLLGAAGLALAFVWVSRRTPPAERRVIGAAVLALALGAAAALTPTTIQHWRSLQAFNEKNAGRLPAPLPRFAPVTSYGAFNFAMANHEHAEGGPNSDHPSIVPTSREEAALLEAGQLDLAITAIHRLYVDGYRIGLSWMVRHPLDAAALWWTKAGMAAGGLGLGYGLTNWPVGVDGVRRRVDLIDPSNRLLVPVQLLLLAVGFAALRRQRPAALAVLAVPLATLAASTLLFYGYARLVAAYLPVIWVLQAAGLASLAERFAPRPRAPSRFVVFAAAVVAAGTLWALLAAGAVHHVRVDGPLDDLGRVLTDETVTITRVP